MRSAASCCSTFAPAVAPSMKGRSSGHACRSLSITLIASCPTASHTFLRMCRWVSPATQATSSDLRPASTGAERHEMNGTFVLPSLLTFCMMVLRSSTAQSERTWTRGEEEPQVRGDARAHTNSEIPNAQDRIRGSRSRRGVQRCAEVCTRCAEVCSARTRAWREQLPARASPSTCSGSVERSGQRETAL